MSVGSPAATPILDEVEVLVVGAGPAGSCCAARLAEHGHDVLVVDQSAFPRHKACGDGITDASVGVLERLGLSDLVTAGMEVRGIRTFFGAEPKLRSLDRPARCISRARLDQALLSAAVERGARFAQLRVDGPLIEGGKIVGALSTAAGGGLLARCVVAADGATSRLRRDCGFLPPPTHRRAYAVRQYVRTEQPLPPCFDLTPLVHGNRELLGYGWVFPLDEHTANVGVGYYRSRALADPPSLNGVLDEFIAELMGGKARYGEIVREGKPLGSPLAIDFNAGRCQFQRVLFVGDAAQTTEPITGEGIGNALLGGEIAADAAGTALNGAYGPQWHEGLALGRDLDRRLLRIGQDVDLFKRALARRLASSDERPVMRRTSARKEPFFSSTAHAIAEPYELPSIRETSIYALLEQSDPGCAAALDALNEAAMDGLLTRFPFTPEALHSRLRRDPGPLAGALLLLTARPGAEPLASTAVTAALGVEMLGMFPDFLRQTVDRPGGEGSKFNNIFAILVADFVVSRALRNGASVGGEVAAAIGSTSCSMCEAEMTERTGAADRTRQTYLRAAELRDGALFGLAAGIGAAISGCGPDRAKALTRFSQALGVAHRIAQDTCDLFTSEARGREGAERALHEGFFTLPAIEAARAEGIERAELGRDPAASLLAIRGSRGIDRVLAECEARARVAIDALDPVGTSGALETLAELPAERIRSALKAAAQPMPVAKPLSR